MTVFSKFLRDYFDVWVRKNFKEKNNEFNVQIYMQCNLSIFIKLTVDEIVIHELLFFSSLLFPQFSTLISFELMRHFPHRLSL